MNIIMFSVRATTNSLINRSLLRLSSHLFSVNSFYSVDNQCHLFISNQIRRSLVNHVRSRFVTGNHCVITFSDEHQSNGKRKDESETGTPLLAAGFFSAFLSFLGWDDLLSKEDPFILTIKRGILCIQREEFDKAEIILHAALTNAVDTENEKAIIYIYSLLGNAAFLKGDYDKSERIYKDLIKRLLKQGIEEDHEAMVEISIKLATIYSKLGKFSKADAGFNHCIAIQKKRAGHIETDKPTSELSKEEINSLALYGMVLDFYGKHLLRKQEFEGALRYTLDALKICEKVNGTNAHQTMVLLSDAGALLNLNNHFDEADNYFQRAIKIGTIIESDHLKTLHYNVGMNNIMRRNWSLAQQGCNASYIYAKKDEDMTIMSMAEECLRKAKAQEA